MQGLKIIWILLVLTLSYSLKVSDFKPAMFHSSQPSGFYRVDSGLGAGKVLWFGDLNGDRYTDYISYKDSSTKQLQSYFWDQKQSEFIPLDIILKENNSTISQVIICDLDGDRSNQALITYAVNQSSYFSQVYSIKCEKRSCVFTLQIINDLLSSMSAVPTVIDVDGSGRLQILMFKSNASRALLSYNHDTQPRLTEKSWKSYVSNPSLDDKMVGDHFTSTIDINGDCFSDLVFISRQDDKNSVLQFFIKDNNNLYKELPPIQTLSDIKWMSFTDFDRNGAVDILFLVFQNSTYRLYIIYNDNKPADICTPSEKFPFSWSKKQEIILPEGFKLMADSSLKIADFNFDGFPDIIGIFSKDQYKRASILMGSGTAVSAFDVGVDVMASISHPLQVCVYDFDQNGRMDLLIISQVQKDDNNISHTRTSIVNNIIQDALFVKIFPLLPNTHDLDQKDIAHAIGITVQWIVTNLNGDKTIGLLNQKSQWNFGTVQLPFVVSGLGRTNNYIEDLTVGYPGYGQKSTWTPIIPNSQLMVKRTMNSQWPLETLLKDNSRVYQMMYISVVCLILMGILIVFLNWRENQEDKRDHYNFIHMIR